jgi:glyoxylase-like metal-dependent hydrolase (beta-lactamase superfamily II)
MSLSTETTPPTHATPTLRVGRWRLDILNGGRFLMDGGVMFGVVPKRLWQMSRTPDELNRLPCACNCVLARDGSQTVLIDAGYGGKLAPLDRKFYALEPGEPLLDHLSRLGVTADAIDTVVLSHLHWDHAGGLTRRGPRGDLVPTFGRARHVVGRWEWEDAQTDAPEFGGAYNRENFAPLVGRVPLDLVEHNQVIVPGLRALVTGGHTRGHLALLLESEGETALLIGDICPSTQHLRRLWSLAYDLYPLETRRRKPHLLGQAADRNWLVLWYHDPRCAASRVARDTKREFVITETWSAP